MEAVNGVVKRTCLICGRTTRHPSQVCNRCMQSDDAAARPDESVVEPLEDDYFEESNADSVCFDDSLREELCASV
ncbi:MAG TPA: hypothetical protein PK098_06560 [Phycisphaerales bacterium]|nr:hypothetical protein [Phycisphaerales bacterium]